MSTISLASRMQNHLLEASDFANQNPFLYGLEPVLRQNSVSEAFIASSILLFLKYISSPVIVSLIY